MRVDHEEDAVDHLHDPLDFAAEIGVAWSIDDIDPVAVPVEGGVLGANRDPFLALEVHRVHHPFLDLLIGAEGARLAQQLIDQRGLAVVNVSDDGDVADLIHEMQGATWQASAALCPIGAADVA